MIRIEVASDASAAARRAADVVAEVADAVAAAGRRFAWAISGGRSPEPMFRRLDELEVPWHASDTWQVDERVAPPGHPDRNRTVQTQALPRDALRSVRWMPVEDDDLDGAADGYGSSLPTRFDVIHLGLGADGHTASLVPGDPILDVVDRDVAVTDPFQGRRRMSLTYPGVHRARRAVWVVTGADKRSALQRLLARDRSIPAGRVEIEDQLVLADTAAHG